MSPSPADGSTDSPRQPPEPTGSGTLKRRASDDPRADDREITPDDPRTNSREGTRDIFDSPLTPFKETPRGISLFTSPSSPSSSKRIKRKTPSSEGGSTSSGAPASSPGSPDEEEAPEPQFFALAERLQSERRRRISEDEEEWIPSHFLDRSSYRKDQATGLYSSPEKRRALGASILSYAKVLALAADPNFGHCMVTGVDEPDPALEWAHILARATGSAELTTLEWHFGYGFFRLYIDSRWNVVRIRNDWHHHSTIKKVHKWISHRAGKNKKRPQITKLWDVPKAQDGSRPLKIRKHAYFMLPLHEALKTVVLHRRPNIGEPFDPDIPEDRHIFPYQKVGPLTSHVHPHLVIYAAGQKLAFTEKEMGAGFNTWLTTLAGYASFGHEKNAASQNMASLQCIQYIYKICSSKDDMPADDDRWYKRT
ncbi:hypothetical protein C8R44DRAFT_982696 [Mycena epipterygia]|nr:hypothetical protein C8R44DRAFT_982696 [Mycena epipterygia]